MGAEESAAIFSEDAAAGSPLYWAALEACSSAMCIVDVRPPGPACVVYVNAAFCTLTGYAQHELLGRPPTLLLGPETAPPAFDEIKRIVLTGERGTVLIRFHRKDGSAYWDRVLLAPVHDADGELTHYIGAHHDVSEQLLRDANLQTFVETIDRTGAGGRVALESCVQDALADAAARGEFGALLLCESRAQGDLSAPGAHQAVDAVQLRRVRKWGPPRTQSLLLGGGRLAVLLPAVAGETELLAAARKLRSALASPLRLGPTDVLIDVRIGAAQLQGAGRTAAGVIAMSEEALERACTDAATICLAREPCDAEGQMREALLRDLEHAVARGELRLEFQPQVQIDDGQIVGFEALLRWQHPRYGLLGPGRFIALAEAGGQIGALSEWVLEHALAQLAEWEAQGHDGLRIAVNMPPALMALPAIEALLRQRLEQTGLKGQQIELELTESSLVAAKGETIARIERLRRLGVRIAIDDFGTGYSNLGYLSRLPVDCVKIDLSFTQAALANPSDAAICRMICNLAQTLQLRVVVEGVETEGQLHFFADLPCHEAQGYLFSRPLAPEAATDLLARGKRFSAVRQPRADGAGARHLLLLDDEEFVLSSLRRLLRRTGVRVHIANTPEQAFELLAREPIGVVISDQRMPAMSGTEFLRRVKSLHPDTIRIVLSGYTELQSIADAINEGAIFRFLTKPWNDEQLIRHIEQAFEQYEVVAENRRLQAELQALRDAVNDARAGKAECIVVGSRAPGRAGLTAGAAR